MTWKVATSETGFAFRRLSNGRISVKHSSGAQWAVSFDDAGDSYVDEIKKQHQHHADKVEDWEVLLKDDEVFEIMQGYLPPTLSEKNTNACFEIKTNVGLRKILIEANNLKSRIGEVAFQIEESDITDDTFDAKISDLIVLANLLRNLL